jgi:hypothetical protein
MLLLLTLLPLASRGAWGAEGRKEGEWAEHYTGWAYLQK